MLDTLKKWVPITYDAFMDYRVGGTEVSAKGKLIIQKLKHQFISTPETKKRVLKYLKILTKTTGYYVPGGVTINVYLRVFHQNKLKLKSWLVDLFL